MHGFNFADPIRLFAAACCVGGLTASPLVASAQVIVDPDEEESEFVPHIVIADDAGALVIEEFEVVTPTPASELLALFPQFNGFLSDDTPTLVVGVGAGFDTSGAPAAFGTGFTVPGTDVTTFEFISAPVAGESTGFLNDDNGFEVAEDSGGLPAGTDVVVDLSTDPGLAAINSPFFVALGASLFTNIGDPEIGALDGPGFEVLEDGIVVDVITGDTLADFFALGASFDTHPLFGLSLESGDATGAALIDVAFSDAGGQLTGSESFQFLITNDPAAFEVVPEPGVAAALGLVGIALVGRRRSVA
ncbi:MAG: PEP-CTERM sorting domain-containing protein [Planctomycetota bacterium]